MIHYWIRIPTIVNETTLYNFTVKILPVHFWAGKLTCTSSCSDTNSGTTTKDKTFGYGISKQ